jgi:hypothetical protein
VTLGADASYTLASESMDAIDLSASPEVLERLHWSTYDLSTIHEYSDLDASSWDVTVRGEVRLAGNIAGTASYTYLDYDDDAPYLADLSGRLDIFQLGLRWTF